MFPWQALASSEGEGFQSAVSHRSDEVSALSQRSDINDTSEINESELSEPELAASLAARGNLTICLYHITISISQSFFVFIVLKFLIICPVFLTIFAVVYIPPSLTTFFHRSYSQRNAHPLHPPRTSSTAHALYKAQLYGR